jgi:ankyrin repeat protein
MLDFLTKFNEKLTYLATEPNLTVNKISILLEEIKSLFGTRLKEKDTKELELLAALCVSIRHVNTIELANLLEYFLAFDEIKELINKPIQFGAPAGLTLFHYAVVNNSALSTKLLIAAGANFELPIVLSTDVPSFHFSEEEEVHSLNNCFGNMPVSLPQIANLRPLEICKKQNYMSSLIALAEFKFNGVPEFFSSTMLLRDKEEILTAALEISSTHLGEYLTALKFENAYFTEKLKYAGWTLYHVAIKWNSAPCLAWLLENKNQLKNTTCTATDIQGKTPLFYAIEQGKSELALDLIAALSPQECAAPMNISSQLTPFLVAGLAACKATTNKQKTGLLNVIDSLIKKLESHQYKEGKKVVNVPDKNNVLLLRVAVETNSYEVAKKLIESGAEIFLDPLLKIAVAHQNVDLVKMLLEKGPKIAKNNDAICKFTQSSKCSKHNRPFA